jgi:hypothetical protein
LVLLAVLALALNFGAGVGQDCSDQGFASPCASFWTLSGWVVLACVAGLIAIAATAVVRRMRR